MHPSPREPIRDHRSARRAARRLREWVSATPNVFVKHRGAVHHSWGSELLFRPYPTGNTRHIDTLWPLWNVLDLTPDGRGKDWYPSLDYSYD